MYDRVVEQPDKQSADDESCTGPFIIRKDSRLRLTWNIIMTFVLLTSFFMIPFNIGFEEPDPHDLYELKRETFCDVMFVLDIFMGFVTEINSEPGEQLTQKKVAQNYLRSNFLPDFLSCVPSLLRTAVYKEVDSGASPYYALKVLRFT